MAARFVALDIALPSPGRCEIAAVVDAPEQVRRLLYLVGADPLAARARTHAEPDVEVVLVDDLSDISRAIIDLADEAPWVTFDQASRLAVWREQDTTGAFDAIPMPDAGDLAALAMPWISSRSLEGFLAEALAFCDQAGEQPEPTHGLAFAEAVAALWRLLPVAIGQRPYAVRHGLADLLDRSGTPLGEAWRLGVGSAPPGEHEPTLLDSFLRARLRELTPEQTRPEELPEPRPISADAVERVFAPDGLLAAAFDQWEPRPGQIQMARAVAEALSGGELLLAEAGTGTGKSLAYLAPAVMFAVENKTPVVISTATRNLQDQLFGKDLPLLRSALDFEFVAELIKGRGNYLCVEKLLRELLESGLLPLDDQVLAMAYLLSWAAASRTGDLDELSSYLLTRYPKLSALAYRLASDGESCTAVSARNHPCFATVARRRAFAADVLVVNHALALANTAVEILPRFAHIIFDEAHNLEDIATEAFGLELERRGLLQSARECGASRDQRALHNRVRRALGTATGELVDNVLAHVTAVEQAAAQVIAGADELGERLAGVVMHKLRRTMEELTQIERLRLDPTFWHGVLGEGAYTAGENLLARAQDLQKTVATLGVSVQVLRGAAGFMELPAEEMERLDVACQTAQSQWAEQSRIIAALLALDDEKYVYWLEFVLRREAWEWRLRAAPIEPGEDLAGKVYEPMTAVVLTSATLSVDRSFDFFASRLGLLLPSVKDRYRALSLPSPFDYAKSVLLGLPTNICQPNDKEYEQHVAKAIRDLTELLQGRTLALFTSNRAMRGVYERVASRLEEQGIEVLCQGVSGSRHVLAERFRTHERALLLGTRSFWEGIDVPGDALSCVVIARLPFSVPKDPVFEARCEHLEARGINAWSQYAVPQAVILFKQGFGRLIRRVSDRGVVVCLDRRLLEMGYGRAFLRSVPGYTSVFDRWSEVRERVREWLERRPAGASRDKT
ncbi:MAG: hypothetical protein HZB16_09810 [Armatimonadetes bacterium]|nr:hypothetical protein [Armatimonadota bacterium]